MIIYKAILKYGYENFRVMILEYCSEAALLRKKKVLLKREQYYIDTFKPQYNILRKSASSYGYRHTEETKNKFRNRKFTAEARLKLSKASTGRKIDATTRMKISSSHKGKVLSEETKSKISKSRTKIFGVKVEVINLLSGAIDRYDSLTLASKELGVSRTAVAKAAKSGNKLKNTYQVNYITKD